MTRLLHRLRLLARLARILLPLLLRRPKRAAGLLRDYLQLRSSALFDAAYYREQNPDVAGPGADPVLHYLMHGADEGRDPSPAFSTSAYLQRNPDVRGEAQNPLLHYLRHGQAEGRSSYPVVPAGRTGAARRAEPAVVPELRRSERLVPASRSRAPQTVDVVIPVHNALDDVRRCLASVLENSSPPFHVIVVNDGSDAATTAFLSRFAAEHAGSCTLLSHETALGYTTAANVGLERSHADYVVLLNSDTTVPAGWLERLLACGESREPIGIVGPLSNAASYQSVPCLRKDGDWCVNELPAGVSVDAMAALVERCSEQRYPRVNFLNGFCYAIKRSVIDAIGVLDSESFPRGYGEENDYSLRARASGFELAVADDLYVLHAKSKSFSHEARRELSAAGRRALDAKHGADRIQAEIAENEEQFHELDALRGMVATVQAAQQERGVVDVLGDPPISVLFLAMDLGGGGGGHSIVQEANGLRRLGIPVFVALHEHTREKTLEMYPSIDTDLFFFLRHETELIRFAARFTVVVATHFETVEVLARVHDAARHTLPAYYVQDYEPWLVPESSAELRSRALASYTAIPDLVSFAKTAWIRETVNAHHGVTVQAVVPSLDRTVYSPRRISRAPGGPVHVVAMVRPSTPRRAPMATLQLLQRLQQRCGAELKVSIFGCQPDHPFFDQAPKFAYENLGILRREEVADLLGSADVFLDFSVYQAFGRTGLEAMAVGCVPVLPSRGGAVEYAVDGTNARVVDSSDENAALAALTELMGDTALRLKLSQGALHTAGRYAIQPAALSELLLFQREYLSRVVTVLVPIFNAYAELSACLDSVLAHTRGPYELLLIDDASTDPRVGALLDRVAGEHSFVRALRNEVNLGYTATVNRGCRACAGDVVLLNSDTLVTPGWLEKLRAAARSRPRVATVTPLSNAAGAFSVPENNAVNALPLDVSVELMAELVDRASEHLLPAVPTGNGFCMYVTRRAFTEVGAFDSDAFPRGYGEENDFCMRALAQGYENLIEDSTFVFHHRSASFGDEKAELAAAGSKALEDLHPDYKARVRAWLANDPLDRLRERLTAELAVYRASGTAEAARAGGPLLYVLHNGEGGTKLTTVDLLTRIAPHRDCYLLQCDLGFWQLSRMESSRLVPVRRYKFPRPWLIAAQPDDDRRKALESVLATSRPELVHVRHLIGFHPEFIEVIQRQHQLPVVVSVHDMYTVCPTIQLFDDTRRYCGGVCTQSSGQCQVSKRWFTRVPPLKHDYVHDWRQLVGPALAAADALVVTSRTVQELLRQHHPYLRPERFHLIEHGRDLQGYDDAFALPDGALMNVAYFGALGAGKGIYLVHELLKLSRERRSPIKLHILGGASLPFDPDEVGAVYHGPYERDDLPRLLAEIRPSVAILPSIGPETYCHALTEAWACGIPVLGSSLGAVGERLRAGGGWVLPPVDPEQWLDRLTALAADPEALEQEHRRIADIRIPTVEDMSQSYLRLYRGISARHSSGSYWDSGSLGER